MSDTFPLQKKSLAEENKTTMILKKENIVDRNGDITTDLVCGWNNGTEVQKRKKVQTPVGSWQLMLIPQDCTAQSDQTIATHFIMLRMQIQSS